VTDPFDVLAEPLEPQDPRPSFRRELRARLVDALDLDPTRTTPTIDLPRRIPVPTAATPVATAVVPYLTAHDAAAALDWYARAFGAVEQLRVVGDDGRLGHAELHIGDARFYLSDEYEEMGVVSPTRLGGTPITLHLTVADVDALYAQAVAAGATGQREPEDQPHGARHGTILDPYGHRWMLSQPIEDVSVDEYADRSAGTGFTVRAGTRVGAPYVDGIWGAVAYRDVDAGIRFVTEVLGFEELVLVRGDDGVVAHSEYRWPEGGIVQLAGVAEANPFLPPPGTAGFYVVTADPQAVWDRCRAAGVEVLRDPYEPHYDPGGMGFSIRDPEGNTWSFGSYAGGATGGRGAAGRGARRPRG